MINITVTVPEELKKKLQQHEEVNWSAVIRKCLQDYLKTIEIAEAIANKSRLSEKDAEEIGNKIKREIAKRHNL